uniref:Uncharacterized protein n=1 Tax=Oryza barthii TaxID=65489 RepID=A0A0D3GHH3_9ORYZ
MRNFGILRSSASGENDDDEEENATLSPRSTSSRLADMWVPPDYSAIQRVKDVTWDKTAFETAWGVNLQWFWQLGDGLYPVLRLRDAIQPSARDEGETQPGLARSLTRPRLKPRPMMAHATGKSIWTVRARVAVSVSLTSRRI